MDKDGTYAADATVLLTMLLTLEWMKPGYALAAGMLLALWLTTLAQRKASLTLVIAAGLAFGSAAQVNFLMLPFPALVAMVMLSMRCRKQALGLLAVFLVLPLSR